MSDLHEAVESLLNESIGRSPTDDLKTILELLQENDTPVPVETPSKRRTSSGEPTQSLRQRLGSNMDSVKDCLCEMMADRVGIEDLLPMTYDEDANEDAMADHNALTLTNASLLAAQVYARLLALPGAFAAGLVDLHALSELPRVLARWRTECIGREWAISGTNQKNNKHRQSTKRARTMVDQETSDDEDSDEESQTSPFIISVADDNALTEHQLVQRGLELALLMADLPRQKQFHSWNKDCRSAVIDAVSSSLATTAALFFDKRRRMDGVDPQLETLATAVVEMASRALREWLTMDSSLSMEAAAEILIDVQRNLYSLITLTESDLPNGDEGRLAAGQAASDAFQSLAFAVYAFVTNLESRFSSSTRTPVSGRRGLGSGLDTGSNAPVSHRKKRAELRRSIGASPTPLKLKKRDSINQAEDRRLSYYANAKQSALHPLLQKVASMMQRLLTDRQNVNSRTRGSTCAAVEQCLVGSTNRDLIETVLRWVVKIFDSNAEFHRLAAIQIGGFVLVNDSLVEGMSYLEQDDDDDDVFERDFATVVFSFLLKRLCDLKQPVRIAAANELIAIFERVSNGSYPTLQRLLHVEADNIADMFRSLVLEESSINGKIASIKGLVSLLSIGDRVSLAVTAEDVEVLAVTCQDSKSVMLRVAAADGLSALLGYNLPNDSGDFITNRWSQSIIPLVLDSELKVQTKALSLIDEIILNPIIAGPTDDLATRSWKILTSIGCASVQPGGSKIEMEALRFAIAKSANVAKILSSVQRAGRVLLEGGELSGCEAGLWCLLYTVMRHKDNIKDVAAFIKRCSRTSDSFDFAINAFFSMFDADSDDGSMMERDASRAYCLEVLGVLAFCQDVSFARIRDTLEIKLSKFQLSSTFIAAAVRLLMASILSSIADPEEGMTACTAVINQIFERCEQEVLSRTSQGRLTTHDDQILARVLCTMGELRLVGFAPDDTCGKTDVNVLISTYDIDVWPCDRLLQSLLTFANDKSFAEPVRGVALVALGKMCLRDEALAKQSISIFALALQSDESPAVRSNALLCMGDLIVRYTNLADRFLPEMAACLQAGIAAGDGHLHVLTRKHAILALSDLLLQDYIKWRGSLFPCFLVAAIDENEDVALLAESMICGPLKKEKLFSSHFVESLFVFNGCEAHEMMKVSESLSDLSAGTSCFQGEHLVGRKGMASRQRLYELMISQLKDDEKIAVTAGIAKDILARCLHQTGELKQACASEDEDDPAYNVLSDALTILASKTIRPRRSTDETESEDGSKSDAIRKVRGALMNKVSRKHILEHMLPMLVQIREILKSHRSPLLRKLMEYLVVLFRLYPDEVKDHLSLKHSVLLQEVEFDAKRLAKP